MTDNHVLLNVDTIAGGGKTYASTEYCARQTAMGNRRIIALPSKAAIDQCIADLRERHPDVHCAAFHGDTQTKPGHVVAAIINKTKELWEQPKRGCTRFISHAAMLHLPEAFRSGWHLGCEYPPKSSLIYRLGTEDLS